MAWFRRTPIRCWVSGRLTVFVWCACETLGAMQRNGWVDGEMELKRLGFKAFLQQCAARAQENKHHCAQEWKTHPNVTEALDVDFKADGIFWMEWEDWQENLLVVCFMYFWFWPLCRTSSISSGDSISFRRSAWMGLTQELRFCKLMNSGMSWNMHHQRLELWGVALIMQDVSLYRPANCPFSDNNVIIICF